MKNAALSIAAVVITAAMAAGCSSNSSITPQEKASAVSAANSALANPTISSDLSAAENELLNNLQKNFDPKHPFASVKTAVHETYPNGSTDKIAAYAVKTFKPSVMTTKGPGSARDNWLQGVDKYAQSLGGTAAIPGVTP